MDLITATDGATPDSASATDVLRRDHERIRELFALYRRRMDEAPETCRSVAEAICMQWELHTQLEHEIFYPALGDESAAVREAARAHEDIRECIDTIRQWPAESQRDSAMLRMMELASYHMRREEAALLPLAERTLAEQLDAMGRRIERRREELVGSTADLESRA